MNLIMDISRIPKEISTNDSSFTTTHELNYDTDGIKENFSLTGHLCVFVINAIVSQFFNGFLCIFGLLGNSLTIMVMASQGLKDTTNILLSSIAVCDIVYLFTDVSQSIHRIVMAIDSGTLRDFERVHSSVARVYNTALFCSIFIVAVMALERLTAVLFPFLVSSIFTTSRVKCLIGLSLVYSCAFSLPGYFIVDENTFRDESGLEWDGMRVWFILPSIFLYMVPMAVILTCNIVIGTKLHLSNGKVLSQDSTSRAMKRRKELKLFKRLMVVCCLACVSFLPRLLLAWMLFLHFDIGLVNNGYIRVIFSACFHIYASSNFIIYVTLSSKFANTLKKRVCGQRY